MPGAGIVDILFQSGHAADFILCVLAIEAAWLRHGRRWNYLEIAALLGPAAFLVLGLRAAMVGTDWWWIALPLAMSLPIHLIDLRTRLQAVPPN
ncbi:hypothetical protein [Erythrobacter sp. R86502]|uniref:hypothetical protein n=1 Tax=Erythrobacter sp. R86502 TaxID=3093846 RepID=UPI0036D2CE43